MRKKILIAIVLLVLSFGIPFTYSMYRNRASGTASLQGATWSVSINGNNDDINLIPGYTEQEYTLTVTNSSEVDVVYSIEITNIPSGMMAKLDSGEYQSATNNKITFTNAGTILYGGNPVNHTITFKAGSDAPEVISQNINIDVEFKQKLS